jgi:hypothetical protein
MMCQQMSAGLLIMIAYGVKYVQVIGPDWLATARFEIGAKLPEGTTKAQLAAMWQNLLARLVFGKGPPTPSATTSGACARKSSLFRMRSGRRSSTSWKNAGSRSSSTNCSTNWSKRHLLEP